jgi:hypothetical protein
MQGGGKFIKKLIFIELVIVIYIILTSTIVSYHNEKKVSGILIDSVLEWGQKYYNASDQIEEKESRLVSAVDQELSARLSGAVLLQIESKGEAWYVYPEDLKKYYLGKPRDAYRVIENLGIEIENEELINYLYFDKIFPESLAGMFVINTDNKREVYYVSPQNRWGHLLKSPEEALNLLAVQGLGITNENIRKIEVGRLD